MLKRLYRRAEALDGACLRAQGLPADYALRQELLSALEWDSAFRLEHVRSSIRELFGQVHRQSVELANSIRLNSEGTEAPDSFVSYRLQGLRDSLTTLLRALEARSAELGAG